MEDLNKTVETETTENKPINNPFLGSVNQFKLPEGLNKVFTGDINSTEVVAKEEVKDNYLVKNQGMNRKMRRKGKKGQEEYQELKKNAMISELRSVNKAKNKNMSWDELKKIYATAFTGYVGLKPLFEKAKDKDLAPYMEDSEKELLADVLALINRDVKANLSQMKEIFDLHKDRTGHVEMDDIPHYISALELYSNMQQCFNSVIVPLFEHAADIIRKTELRKQIIENEEKARELLAEQERSIETVTDVEVVEETGETKDE